MLKKILGFLELGLGIVKDWGIDEIGWELCSQNWLQLMEFLESKMKSIR